MSELILVTGGAGFIGSHLVEALVAKGYAVRVLDNLTRGKITHIKHLINSGKIEFIDGDIRYMDSVNRAMKNVDYVFHEAAVCINRSLEYPQESIDINLNGSQNVFKSALDNHVKKVMFASSASVYGEPVILPMSEDHPLNPITPYCVSKIAGEYLLKFYARHGLKYVIFRYFNVYGLRQSTDAYYTSVIILFVKRLLAGLKPMIEGDGNQSMDFVNVKDIVNANILALQSDISNQILNVANGSSVSIRDIAYQIIKSLGKEIEPEFSGREVLVKRRQGDISKISKLLGFSPSISVTDGLKQIVEDIKTHPDLY